MKISVGTDQLAKDSRWEAVGTNVNESVGRIQ